MKRWSYGDAWEKYPIQNGQRWTVGQGGKVACVAPADIMETFAIDMLGDMFGEHEADMSYIDPPWNTGNINSFYTKAGLATRREFLVFIRCLLLITEAYSPKINYMEMGKQNLEMVRAEILDDERTPDYAMYQEKPRTVLDLCTSWGLTGRTALKHSAKFYGTELNPRWLACLIQWYAEQGLPVNE